jgi:uncharacterized repeat protein (TIGR03803 family)
MSPESNLVYASPWFYGTSATGGRFGQGTVFEVGVSGAERILYNFTGGSDGGRPRGPCGLVYVNGELYGAAASGGAYGDGTIFEVSLAGKERTVYTFHGGKDGVSPNGGFVEIGGTLYGTTYEGGTYGFGTVFALSLATGEERVLHSFSGGNGGQYPLGGLTKLNGTLYGATSGSGLGIDSNNAGTVFAISTTGSEHGLHIFSNAGDGEFPVGALVAIGNVLYGVTSSGGANGFGSVYSVTPAELGVGETEQVVYSFTYYGADGGFPEAGLVATGGMLYGTTAAGGTSGRGAVFGISAAGSESNLRDFAPRPDGASPNAALVAAGGELFGTTTGGGVTGAGTVFDVKPGTGQERVVYSFRDGDDAQNPLPGLALLGGALYGTSSGGGGDGYGAAFSVSSAGQERVLHRFSGAGADGTPGGALTALGNTLYGTTNSGGAHGYGTIYTLSPSGVLRVLYAFKGAPMDGANPVPGFVVRSGVLYGTTGRGGANDAGTVFSLTSGGVERVLYSFAGSHGSCITADGCIPGAPLTVLNGRLFGTTQYGGMYDAGTVFSVTTSGSEHVVYGFGSNSNDFDGGDPVAGLTPLNGTLFGTTAYGGTQGDGTVFSVSPAGTERVIHNFTGGADGGSPFGGALTAANGVLFGADPYGGATGNGLVFEMTPAGAETVLRAFTGGNDGGNPGGPLLDVGGALYGTTSSGGVRGEGTVFKILP